MARAKPLSLAVQRPQTTSWGKNPKENAVGGGQNIKNRLQAVGYCSAMVAVAAIRKTEARNSGLQNPDWRCGGAVLGCQRDGTS